MASTTFRSMVLAIASVALASAPLTAQGTMTDQSGNAAITFGGTGIPKNAVVTQQSPLRGVDVLLGITATARCAGVVCGNTVTNDGVRTFFADPGAPFGGSLSGWNFDWSITGTTVAALTYRLVYNLDPAVGDANFGYLNILFPFGNQDSQNPGFAFLGSSIPGYVTPPSGGPFDPNVDGEYYFSLEAYTLAGNLAGHVDMFVNVGDPSAVTPEPATMTLLATGLVGMAGMARRRRRKV